MDQIVDLDRFPLDKPGSPEWTKLVTECRTALATGGMFNLDGFMRPNAIAEILDQTRSKFMSEAFLHERMHNIYFKPNLPDVPADHPVHTEFATSNRTLCTDQLTETAVITLYEWQPFAGFLAAVMDRSALYPMDDPLAGVNMMAYTEGQGLNWHFDRSEFTTTLLLQAPEDGGDFLYRTDLRTAEDPNYDAVARLIQGNDSQVQSMSVTPGTLNVFRGVNTPHCVTPTKGKRPRVISVFSYFDSPGVRFSDSDRIGFYGRAT